MSDIRRYITILENAEILDESFKTAQEKFSVAHEDEQEVKEYIEQFKDLAKRNIIKGQDKDIGKWIKAGWDEFKAFIDQSSNKQSKRQYTKKVKSDSITVYEDDDKIVIIPLSEKASCYYGKNTQWCTAATSSRNYFNDYFGNKDITLFYILMKSNGEKFAVAMNHDIDKYEIFDEVDDRISELDLENETGIDTDQIDAWYNENQTYIENARDKYSPKSRIKSAVIKYKSGEYNWSMAMAEINSTINDMDIDNEYGLEISGVNSDGNFVVDVEFIFDKAENLIKYINGDEYIDIGNPAIDYENLYEYLDLSWQNHIIGYIRDNYIDEVKELLYEDDITRSDIEDNLNEILTEIDGLDELKDAFILGEEDASRSEVEGNIIKTINDYIIDQCSELNLKIDDNVLSMIDSNETMAYIVDNDVLAFVEEIEDFDLEDIDDEIDLGVMDYDYLPNALKEHIREAIGEPEKES